MLVPHLGILYEEVRKVTVERTRDLDDARPIVLEDENIWRGSDCDGEGDGGGDCAGGACAGDCGCDGGGTCAAGCAECGCGRR